TDFHPHPDPPPKGEGWVGAQAGHLAWLANKRPALGNSMAGFFVSPQRRKGRREKLCMIFRAIYYSGN
ncbi:MAG: hypothetical protein AB1487_00270, partial [Thermodesulfobacteriota bacterium]